MIWEVLKEGQTKAWDHLQTIELEKLSTKLVSKVSEVEGMISFDHFYTFNRTLKCWTLALVSQSRIGYVFPPPANTVRWLAPSTLHVIMGAC